MCFSWSEPRLIQSNDPALWVTTSNPRSSHGMSLMSLSVWGRIFNTGSRSNSDYLGGFIFIFLRIRQFWKWLLPWEWISLERALFLNLCCIFWLSELICMHMKNVFYMIYLLLYWVSRCLVMTPCFQRDIYGFDHTVSELSVF